jgi:hypothetical protein
MTTRYEAEEIFRAATGGNSPLEADVLVFRNGSWHFENIVSEEAILDADTLNGQPYTYYLNRSNHTGSQNVSTIAPGGEHGVALVNGGLTTWGLIMDANISNVAAIAGSKIAELNDIPGTLDVSKLDGPVDFSGHGDVVVDGVQVVGGQVDLTGSTYPYLFFDSGALTVPYLSADLLDNYHANELGRLALTNTWVLSQVFNAAASFQSPTVPFVVVGTDEVTNLNANLLQGHAGGYYTDASHLTGNASGLASVTTTGDIHAGNSVYAAGDTVTQGTDYTNEVAIYSNPSDLSGNPTMDLVGASIYMGAGGGSIADVRVGRSAAGVFAALTGLNRADELGATGQNAAFFRNASNLNAGTLLDARLSSNVPLKDGSPVLSTNLTLPNLIINAAAGVTRDIQWRTAGTSRWFLRVTSTPESGSSAGSDFELHSRSDAAADTTVISIVRATGAVSFSGAVSVGTNLILASPTTASTVGAAGGASALPATPTGYVVVKIAGTDRKLPYYAT